ncbi:hypothetical protein QYF36_006033 [Acer negundo]|nr:hypothetical protein QYF36_006033 [Acer negundo]
MSFVNQIPEMGGVFSYCLVNLGSRSPGWLVSGHGLYGAFPMGAAWAPLLRNPRAPSYYYVGLSCLGVGGVHLPISEDNFWLTQSGDGGVIMDIGTAATRLPIVAYEALRDVSIAKTSSILRALIETSNRLEFRFLSMKQMDSLDLAPMYAEKQIGYMHGRLTA